MVREKKTGGKLCIFVFCYLHRNYEILRLKQNVLSLPFSNSIGSSKHVSLHTWITLTLPAAQNNQKKSKLTYSQNL